MGSKKERNAYGGVQMHPLQARCRFDGRGWVLFPWTGNDPPIDPATIHVVLILPGHTRGNHYHPRVSEWLCPIDGAGVLKWRSPSGGPVTEAVLEPRRTCVRIPPGIRHAVTNTGSGELLLLAARERDPEGDETVPDRV